MKNSYIYAALITAVHISACSPQGGEKINLPAASFSNPTRASIDGAYHQEKSNSLEKLTSIFHDPTAEILRSVIHPLADELLREEIVSNPRSEDSDWLNSSFWILHQSIVKQYGLDKKLLLKDGVLNRYKAALLAGNKCGITSLKSCRNLKYFSVDNSGAISVIKIIAQELTTNIREYYLLLSIAIDMQGSIPDPQLDEWIIDKSIDLYKTFLKVSFDEKTKTIHIDDAQLTGSDRKLLHRYSEIIATTSAKSNTKLSNQSMKELFQWIMNGNFVEIFGKSISQNYLNLITKNIKSDSLWPDFVNIVKNLEYSANMNSSILLIADSLTLASNEIKESNSRMFEVFGTSYTNPIETYIEKDDLIYFYIISRVYAGQSQDYWQTLWLSTEKNVFQFNSILDNFMRTLLAHTTLQTNSHMASLFKNIKKENSKTLLSKAIRNTKIDITPLWADFHKRFRLLKDFFTVNIEAHYKNSTNSNTAQSVTKIRNFFDSLNDNIKFSVTYPNLLMLAYFANIYEYSETFDSEFIRGGFTLDDKQIMSDLMEAGVPPLFIFTDYERKVQDTNKDDPNQLSVNKLEIMYSLYYSIKYNLFSQYNISPLNWFKTIASSYLFNPLESINTWNDAIHKYTEKNADYLNFVSTCQKISEPGLRRFENIFSVADILSVTLLGRLGSFTYADEKSGSLSNVIQNIGPYSPSAFKSAYAEALEVIRSDLNPRLRNLLLIKNIFRTAIDNPDPVLREIDSILEKANQTRSYIFDSVTKYVAIIRDCSFELSKQEHIRRTELFNMELDYLDHLFFALDALQSFKSPNDIVGIVKARFPEHPIWKNSFFQDLDDNLPLLKAFNNLIKEKAYCVRQGIGKCISAFDQIRGYESDYDLNSGIQIGTDGNYFFQYRKMDLALRLNGYLNFGYNGKSLRFTKDDIVVRYPESIQELRSKIYGYNTPKENSYSLPYEYSSNLNDSRASFKKDVLKSSFTEYVKWFFDIFSARTYLRRALQTEVAIYKLKYEFELDPQKFVTCDKSCTQEKLSKMKADSEQLLLFSKNVLNELNINSYLESDGIDDTQTLSWLSENSFYGPSHVPSFIFVETAENGEYYYLGIGDELYNYIISYTLGRYSTYRGYRSKYADQQASADNRNQQALNNDLLQEDIITRPNPFDDAESVFHSLKKQAEALILPIQKDSLLDINASFSALVQTEMLLAYAFEEKVSELKTQWKLPVMQFNLHSDKFNNEYWILQSVIDNYHGDISRFNIKTERVFIPDELKNNPMWNNGSLPVDGDVK